MNNTVKYDSLTRLLHWLTALLIFTMIGIGISMNYVSSESTHSTLMYFHKSIGITLLLLMLIRVFWRLTFMRIPLYNPPLSSWNKKLAHIAHMLIYIGIFIMIGSGWLASSSFGYPVPFWFVNVALPIAGHPDLGIWLIDIHDTVIWILGAIIILHILGAIFHNIKKERILQRML